MHAAFVAHAEAVLADPAPVAVLGIDETRRGKPRWTREQVSGRWVHTDPWDSGFVDLTCNKGLLGQVGGRTRAAVRQWLSERRRVTFDPPGRRGRKQDPERANRRLLLTAD